LAGSVDEEIQWLGGRARYRLFAAKIIIIDVPEFNELRRRFSNGRPSPDHRPMQSHDLQCCWEILRIC